MTPTTNRIYWLDFGKVLAAFLVVFGHLYSGDSTVNQYLYAFHLPFFFLISGIFHQDAGRIQWKKYAGRILLPAVLFLLIDAINSIVHGAIEAGGGWSAWSGKTVEYVKYFILRLARGTGLGPAWFLLALFWCKILADVFLTIRNKWLAGGILLAGLLVPYLLDFRFPLFISQGFMALPFYLAGYYGSSHLKGREVSWKYLWIVAGGMLLTGVLSYFNGKVSMNGCYFGGLPKGVNFIVFYVNAFIGSAMLMGFSLLPFPRLRSVKLLAPALITIVGVQSVFIGLTQLVFGGANQPIPISIVEAILVLWLCYLVHLLIGPLYTPKKK